MIVLCVAFCSPSVASAKQLWDEATTFIATENANIAEAKFLDLLQRFPDFYPDVDTPPKIMTIFLKVRRHFLVKVADSGRFSAAVIRETSGDNTISLVIKGDTNLMKLVTQIIVNVRTRSQCAFRSMQFARPLNIDENIAINFPYPTVHGEYLDYYIDFVGNFNAAFYSIGSDALPRVLVVKNTLAPPIAIASDDSIMQFKAGWPIIISAAFAVLGALTFGLLKLNL